MPTKKKAKDRALEQRQRLIDEFGATEEQLKGATSKMMSLTLEGLEGPGAQDPGLSSRDQRLLEAARTPVPNAERNLGGAIDRAATGEFTLPRPASASSFGSQGNRFQAAEPFVPNIERARNPQRPELQALNVFGLPEDFSRKISAIALSDPTEAAIQTVSYKLERDMPASADGAQRAGQIRGDIGLDTLKLLQDAAAQTSTQGQGKPKAKSTPTGSGDEKKEGGSSLAKLLGVLGAAGILTAVLAKNRKGPPLDINFDPNSLSVDVRQTGPDPTAQLLPQLGATIGQALMQREQMQIEEAQAEKDRNAQIGMTLLKAGQIDLASQILREDFEPFQNLTPEQIRGFEKAPDLGEYLQLAQIVSREGTKEAKQTVMTELWGRFGLEFTVGGLIDDDTPDYMNSSLSMFMLKHGIDPGESSGINPETREGLLGSIAEQKRTEEARQTKKDTRQAKQDELSTLGKFSSMVESMVIAGTLTEPEAAERSANLKSAITSLSKELGQPTPVPADAAAAPVPQSAEVPEDDMFAEESFTSGWLRNNQNQVTRLGRSMTEEYIRHRGGNVASPAVQAELNRIFRN